MSCKGGEACNDAKDEEDESRLMCVGARGRGEGWVCLWEPCGYRLDSYSGAPRGPRASPGPLLGLQSKVTNFMKQGSRCGDGIRISRKGIVRARGVCGMECHAVVRRGYTEGHGDPHRTELRKQWCAEACCRLVPGRGRRRRAGGGGLGSRARECLELCVGDMRAPFEEEEEELLRIRGSE